MAAKMISLPVARWLQSHNNGPSSFQGHGTIEWIYYVCKALYILAHTIVVMNLSSSPSIFSCAEIVLESVGFELMLWTSTSHVAWVMINVCIFVVALVCTARREMLDFLSGMVQLLDDDVF